MTLDDAGISKKATSFVMVWAIAIGVGNFLLSVPMPILDRYGDWVVLVAYAWVGVIGAQGALHAIWCVFARVDANTRVLAGIAIAVFWCGAAVVGLSFHLSNRFYFWRQMGAIVLCLPLIAVAVQTPLWLARFFFRWRVVHPADDSVDSAATPLRIWHILLGTAAVALALGAVRFAVPRHALSETGFVLRVVIAGVVLGAISAATALPLLAITLRARRLWPALSAAGAVYFVVVFTYSALVALMERGFSSLIEMLAVMGTMTGGFLVCLTAVLITVRNLGYRLAWGRRGPRSAAKPASAPEAPGEAAPVGPSCSPKAGDP
jgi:hypothetical protein